MGKALDVVRGFRVPACTGVRAPLALECIPTTLAVSLRPRLAEFRLHNISIKSTGRKVNEITFIMDLEGFHIQQVLHKTVIEMGLDFTRLLQDCYPEIWSYILVVNAPVIFEKAFHIFKPVLRSTTLERMKLADKDGTKQLLLKYIDEDVLPVFLGGTRVDSNGDPKCKEFLKFGTKVPESMYSLNRMTPLRSTDPGVKTYYIGPRSCCNVALVLREAEAHLRMEMYSNGSVTVSVFHRDLTEDDGDDPELPAENEYLDDYDENCKYKMISVCLRAQLHCTPVDGVIIFPKPGVYVIRMSNVGSWFTSRKLLLRYEIVTPTKLTCNIKEDAS